MKKLSIYTKIKNRTITMAVIAVAAFTIIIVIGLVIMRQNVLKLSNDLGDSAASSSKEALISQTEESLISLVKSKAAVSDEKLRVTENYVEQMSFAATTALLNVHIGRESVLEALNDIILKTLAECADSEMAAYYGTEEGEFTLADSLGNAEFVQIDPRERPWYISAKEADTLVWTDVYDDKEGRGLSITCA